MGENVRLCINRKMVESVEKIMFPICEKRKTVVLLFLYFFSLCFVCFLGPVVNHVCKYLKLGMRVDLPLQTSTLVISAFEMTRHCALPVEIIYSV